MQKIRKDSTNTAVWKKVIQNSSLHYMIKFEVNENKTNAIIQYRKKKEEEKKKIMTRLYWVKESTFISSNLTLKPCFLYGLREDRK